jgi:hypothetical protein
VTAEAAIFVCSICGEPAGEICVYCTKDACVNHRCDRCKRCSDCCECDIPLSAAEAPIIVEEVEIPPEPQAQLEILPEPQAQLEIPPEPHPQPPSDRDLAPEQSPEPPRPPTENPIF